MVIPAISLWRPWAQWVAEELKPIETRTHDRFCRLLDHRIAIHAAKKYDTFACQLARPWLSKMADDIAMGQILSDKEAGAIICTAKVGGIGWLGEEHSKGAMIDCKNVIRYGLFLTDIKKLKKPIPYKGRQGIFMVFIPDEVL